MREWIFGRNAVFEVLRANRRQSFQLQIAQGVEEKGRLVEILQLCQVRRIPITRVPRQQLESIHPGHQGVMLQTSGYPYVSLPDILDRVGTAQKQPLLLILDALQDPQNLGTLLRTAEVVGVSGVLLPLRHTVTITPTVVNVASGACEHLLVAQSNLAQSIATLKSQGIWVVGLAGEFTNATPDSRLLSSPLALVVGNEGEGLRQLVRQSCDQLWSLPMQGKIESLNAAVAGSIALYFVWQARGYA